MSHIGEQPLPRYAIYGAGGCGRGVLPVANDMLTDLFGVDGFELVFIDDSRSVTTVNGCKVMTYNEFLADDVPSRSVAFAIAQSTIRHTLAARCLDDGIATFSIRASNSVIMDDVQIGDGAIISPFVTITSNIRIGQHFHANLYSYVEHDCIIGDFVTFAPGVQCNGNVTIEDHAYLGAGCVLRQGRTGEPLVIGRGATVGMGAVVTKSVAPNVTVVGNPARPMGNH